MRFTVATYNIHKGFTQLNRRMVIHELRDRLHGLSADILFLQEVRRRPRAARGAARRLAGQAAARVHRRHGLARGRLRQERDLPPRPPRQRGAVAVSDRRAGEPGHLGAPVRKPRPAALRDPAGPRAPVAALPQRAPRAVRARAAVAAARAVRAHPRRRCPRTRRSSSPATSTTGGTRRTGCSSTSSASSRCSSRCAAGPRARFRRCCRSSASTGSTRAASSIVDAHVHYAFPHGPDLRPRGAGRDVRHAWKRAMNRFLPGNRVTLLRSGGEYFPALVDAIDRAEREVWLETYIYADDDVGPHRHRGAGARGARAASSVRVLVDGWGAKHYLTAAIEGDLVARRRRRCSSTGPRSRRGSSARTGCGGCTASSATSTAGSRSSAASTSSTT